MAKKTLDLIAPTKEFSDGTNHRLVVLKVVAPAKNQSPVNVPRHQYVPSHAERGRDKYQVY
jgi:hypothetical protein